MNAILSPSLLRLPDWRFLCPYTNQVAFQLPSSLSHLNHMEGDMAARKRVAGKSGKKRVNRWVAGVKTVSTFPPEGLFTKSAAAIARTQASKKVSPKGAASGMRMLTYFINRGGKGLSKTRRAELEKAKKLLSKRVAAEKRARESKKAA